MAGELRVHPTIRMESDVDQFEYINSEKESMYDPSISYFQPNYSMGSIEVIGLYTNARGTLSKRQPI